MLKENSNLYLLPVTLGILFPISLLITYVIAVWNGSINALFSYISDTGTKPPESCVFAQLLFFVCILYFGVVYVRYLQIKEFLKFKHQIRNTKKNITAFVIGLISIFGTSLVANFQQDNLKAVHLLGALFCFAGGCVWFIMQALYTLEMQPHFGSKRLGYFRLGLSIFGILLFPPCGVTGYISLKAFYEKNPDGNPTKMQEHHGKDPYIARGASVILEWLLVVLFTIYVFTFIPEFKRLKFQYSKIIVLEVHPAEQISPETLENNQQVPEDQFGLLVSNNESIENTTSPAYVALDFPNTAR